jgi:hypothetical protein
MGGPWSHNSLVVRLLLLALSWRVGWEVLRSDGVIRCLQELRPIDLFGERLQSAAMARTSLSRFNRKTWSSFGTQKPVRFEKSVRRSAMGGGERHGRGSEQPGLLVSQRGTKPEATDVVVLSAKRA